MATAIKKTSKKLNINQPLVISYLRFSNPPQAKGDSTRRQTDLADRWCEANGKTLTDRLDDKGISAFRGRNTNEGALAAFLKLVTAKTVPENSILLVEELDRLSRQEPEESLHLFLSIIRSGITVVTLNTGDVFKKGEIDMGKLMIAVVKFFTAFDESQKKSTRLSEAWKNKRAKIGERVFTRRLPEWLKVVDGKVVVDRDKTAIVVKLFEWATAGHGTGVINKKANHELSSLGRKPYFTRSYIAKILHNRAVIGEFQPHKLVYVDGKKTRVPEGEPILNYYPVIVPVDVFETVQNRMAKNATSGGPMTDWTNIFKGMLHDANDGSRLQAQDKGYGRRFVSAAAIEGRKGASDYVGIPVVAFETAFLFFIAGAVLIQFGNADSRIDEIRKELDAVRNQIAGSTERTNEIKAALVTTGANAVSLVEVLATLDGQKVTLKKRETELNNELRNATASTPRESIDEVIAFIHGAAIESLSADHRMRIRLILSGLIDRIDCKATRDRTLGTLDATICFRTGEKLVWQMQWAKEAGVVRSRCAPSPKHPYDHFVRVDFSRAITENDHAAYWTHEDWRKAVDAAGGGLVGAKAVAVRMGRHWSSVYRQLK